MTSNKYSKNKEKHKSWEKGLTTIITFLINVLMTIPTFIYIYRILPDWHWPYELDMIVIYLTIFAAMHLILKFLNALVLPFFVLSIAFLTYGTIRHEYGFKSLYKDYEAMIYTMAYKHVSVKIIFPTLKTFPNEKAIRKAIDFQSPIVRDFAHYAINEHFKDIQKNHPYRQTIQCFSIFKEINSKWNYVNDPKSRDYFAKASESIKFLSGDCDDHSILMAACIKAVGGKPRLILTTGHLYPELFIGDKNDLEHINLLIRKDLFAEASNKKRINYHIDTDGKVWINLDYTDSHPGGAFLNEKVIGILVL